MSIPLAANPSTWEPMHPDRGPQLAKHGSASPRESPNPPSYSSYVYVPAPLGPFQPISVREGQQNQLEENQNDNKLIQSTVFPLPPTVAEREPSNPYYTFPHPPPLISLPLSPTFTNPTPNENTNTNKDNDQQSSCYFETLDFSDYLPTRRVLDNGNQPNQNHHPYRPRTQNAPIGRGAAAFPAHLRGEYPGPNGYNYNTFTTHHGNIPLGTGSGTAAGRFDLKRSWWRATRGAVVVVWMVVLLTGLLAMMGFAVVRGVEAWDVNINKGGGRFIGEVGDGWGPCTDARPRFCRLVVGAGR